ncbi:MAG: hypothetical protein VX589_11635 [Myxococcota bacterium]|nr:hypothetical protein [Myxococcota bacterium]
MRLRASLATLIIGVVGYVGTGHAADAVTKASVRTQSAGNQMAKIWITGRGFQAGSTVMISGDGITELNPPTVVPEAMRRDGGVGDGIIYDFAIAAAAPLGARNITVTSPTGETATGVGILEITAGMGAPPQDNNQQGNNQPPDNMPMNGNNPMPNQGMQPAQPSAGSVDQVTRASPYYMEQGAQVNIWIVGKGFQPGARLTFSNPGIEPALDAQNMPLPVDVYKNVPSEAGTMDGIQYFAVVGPPQTTALGFVNVTVTNPDGSMATGLNLMEIVPAGMLPERRPGQGNLDSITAASPMVTTAGKKVAMWIWGKGIATGARVQFSNPAIQSFRPSEVVEQSQSHPGFSGIRNFLQIAPNAVPGPVNITITNPNGSSQVLANGFQIVGGGGIMDANANPTDQGNCPDLTTSIGPITAVAPTTVSTGQMVSLQLQGQAFACGCRVIIPGGGIRALDQPLLSRDPLNPLLTTLSWPIYIEPNAELGARDIQIVNPNNTSQVAPRVLNIVAGQAVQGQGPGFQPGVGMPANGAMSISMMAPVQTQGGMMSEDDDDAVAAGGCVQSPANTGSWAWFLGCMSLLMGRAVRRRRNSG